MSVTINGSAGVTTNSGAVYNGLQSGTAVSSTSGTAIDFTSIPSWVKRITVMFSGVSTSGTSNLLVRFGTAGGIVSTGYVASCGFVASTSGGSASTAGFNVTDSMTAANSVNGTTILTQLDSSTNKWTSMGNISRSGNNEMQPSSGTVTLSGAVTTVRITTVNGTDTFDAGSINIIYE